MATTTSITVEPQITEVTATDETSVSINITTSETTVEAALTFYTGGVVIDADNVYVDTYGTITSTNLQTVLQQLADQDFRGAIQPSGSTLEIGDTWYDTINNIFYVYRTVSGVTDWHPIISGDANTSDQLDGGAF